ncbi:OmpA family protein [Myxococcota bacterium]|nr:OmpA family protein [Myxococcota bacterium]
MTRFKAASIFSILMVSLFALVPKASAQGGPIDIQLFRPAMDSKGHFSVDSTQVLGHMKISFGFGVTNAFKPLELEGNGRSFVVDQMLTATVQFAIGLFQHFELGVGMPFSISKGVSDPLDGADPAGRWNQGDNPSNINAAPMGYDEYGKFGTQGAGDAFFNLKWRIHPAAKGPVGLAAMISFSLPTGNDEAFMSTGGFTLAPKFIVDKRLSKGKMMLSGNLGARLRFGGDHLLTANSGWDNCNRWDVRNPTLSGSVACSFDGNMDNNMTQNISQLYDVTYGVGFSWRLAPKVELVTEMFGSVEISSLSKEAEERNNPVDNNYTLEFTKNVMPLEALAGVKLYLAASSYLAIGGGVGLTGIAGMDHVGAPDFRLFAIFSFEPFIGDRDGDGIPDDIDKCPDDPEDFDSFQDEDGCPDLDNDQDRILDVNDKCPNDPETYNNFEDEDGCPDDVTSDRDGDGILDDKDQCPDNPEDFDQFEDQDGCPEEDNDGDGLQDVKDICPGKDGDKKNAFALTKEDFDSWQDDDGCPDPDNDGDGLLDKVDKCPDEPETFNGFEDEDGCPDEGKVRVTAGKLEIYEKIYFATNKAEILPESFGILDAIAATLKAHPQILRIEIQGHTDDRNTDAYNLKLSDDRANSVRDYLIDKGVAPSRLIAKGYGESRPIDKRFNEEARAKNRRVEFIILERGSGKIVQ